MPNAIETLLSVLDLEKLEENLFRGRPVLSLRHGPGPLRSDPEPIPEETLRAYM